MAAASPKSRSTTASFQDLVNEARLRLVAALPGVVRAQRLRPRDHARRAVLVADRDDHLPAQPRAREAARHAAQPARDRDRAAGRGHDPRCASGSRRRRPSRSTIPAGETEVGTIRTANEEAIIFQTTEDFTIPPARPIAYAVKRGGAVKDVGVAGGIAKPKGPDQVAFGSPPKAGDALYIGFDVSLANMLLEVDVDCSQARGAGVDPEDPPLRWEVSDAEEESGWLEAEVVEDLTGGFNYGAGKVTIQLPDRHTAVPIAGHRALLGLLPPRHEDALGRGRRRELHAPAGDPRRSRRRRSARSSPPRTRRGDRTRSSARATARPARSSSCATTRSSTRPPEEYLEVLDPDTGDLGALGAGRVVRREQADRAALRAQRRRRPGRARARRSGRRTASWRQYGGVPKKGATLRMSRYRHGGGREGNVAAGHADAC